MSLIRRTKYANTAKTRLLVCCHGVAMEADGKSALCEPLIHNQEQTNFKTKNEVCFGLVRMRLSSWSRTNLVCHTHLTRGVFEPCCALDASALRPCTSQNVVSATQALIAHNTSSEKQASLPALSHCDAHNDSICADFSVLEEL